jgi:predicted nuclease of restriction endonuclease-like (RecB) superfamily
VFNPYTGIKTNLLFFTKGEPTKEVWYYEHPYPAGVQELQQDQAHAHRRVRAERPGGAGPPITAALARKENEFAWKVASTRSRPATTTSTSRTRSEARAAYGQNVLAALSARLTEDFGKGFTTANLRNFRQFYLAFTDEQIRYALRSNLTWTHLRQLMRIDNLDARNWYMRRSQPARLERPRLDRQISHALLRAPAFQPGQGRPPAGSQQPDRRANPGRPARLHPRPLYPRIHRRPARRHPCSRSELETGLIQQLQAFLLELGKGFAFVARQKHLRVENEDCFIDLVFYNYLLKCFVLIDLKIGKLAHQDVGQMDMYVRVFEEQYRAEGDNPTLGLILCSERNEAVAKYSLLAGSQQLFASRYRPFLPSEAELQAELQRDRALLENQREAQA